MLECIDAIFAKYNWEDMQATLNSPDYFWGLTHGDFHPGQLMFKTDGSGELVLLDWEYSGIHGNPSLDIVTYIWGSMSLDDLALVENEMIETYYLALIDGGVRQMEYPYEKLYSDYRTFGFGQFVLRNLLLSKAPDVYFTGMLDRFTAFVNMHGLTPEEMVSPVYGYF